MKTLFVAHRGAQLAAPENTVTAFRLAISKGYRAMECDVQLTKDEKLVVIHDETVDRTTDGQGWVSQLTLSQIRDLHVEQTEQVPTLREVYYQVVVSSQRKLILEIKADSVLHAKKTAVELAHYINHLPKKYRKYIEVHSFWYEALKAFKQASPATITGAIINGGFSGEQIVAIARDTDSNGVSLGYEFLSNKIVRECHKARLFVDTWAVSDGTVLRRIRPFGITAIVENFTGTTLR